MVPAAACCPVILAAVAAATRVQVKKKDEHGATAREEEERTVSVMSSLLAYIARQSKRDRVAAKFVEAEFEKCDRLMEVYFRCEGRVAAEEAR